MSANPAGALPEGLHELDGQVVGRFGSLWLGSHFQPIFSLAHGRVVGHEALLRAKGDDGQAVSPLSAFQRCHTVDEIALCDTLSRRAHLLNYARARVEDQWLFLNVNARAFLHGPTQHLAAQSAAWLKTAQIRPEQVVVELLEDAIEQLGVLECGWGRWSPCGRLLRPPDIWGEPQIMAKVCKPCDHRLTQILYQTL